MAQITRKQPFSELADLRSRLDRVFADLGDGGEGNWNPEIDVMREKDRFRIHANVPGVKPEDIKIDVADDVLTISGSHKEEKEVKERQYVHRERRVGSFTRSIALPPGTDPNKIQAKAHDGVLDVIVPLPKSSARKQVSITAEAG